MGTIKRIERGTIGYDDLDIAIDCRFRRNTLITSDREAIVVVTIGNRIVCGERLLPVNHIGDYYETTVYKTLTRKGRYPVTLFNERIAVESRTKLSTPFDNNDADAMHEKVVNEIVRKMEEGIEFETVSQLPPSKRGLLVDLTIVMEIHKPMGDDFRNYKLAEELVQYIEKKQQFTT